MRLLILFLTILLISCSRTDKKHYLFERLEDKEIVTIYLSKYNLHSVPGEIGRLKKVRKLHITADSVSGWIIYPPMYDPHKSIETPPFRKLPNEITELSALKTLELIGLDLKTLPDDFGKLENLDTLNLMRNKLIISNELGKLKKLKKLNYLVLVGNKIDTVDIKELQRENPGLNINSGIE